MRLSLVALLFGCGVADTSVLLQVPVEQPNVVVEQDCLVTRDGACAYVRIPAGTFTMGSPEGEPGRLRNERQHQVTLTRDFWMKTTEVTQGEWFAVMGTRPAFAQWCGDDCPVERVNWYEAAAYANTRSFREGLSTCYRMLGCSGQAGDGMLCDDVEPISLDCDGYRLPTEAEFEYAARAGTQTMFFAGDMTTIECGDEPNLGRTAWSCNNSALQRDEGVKCVDVTHRGGGECVGTHPARTLDPNPWGLYDIHGNVYEWVHDLFVRFQGEVVTDPTGAGADGEARTKRGGSFDHPGVHCRAAQRSSDKPNHRAVNVGFRLVRTVIE